MPEITKELNVVNRLGIHARPAAAIVQSVLKFESDVYFNIDGHRINAKSIMGLLTLAATQGTRIVVTVNGADAEAAMRCVEDLFANGFGEG
jgi:phosphocarrier protein